MAFTEPERVKIRRYMGWPPGALQPYYDSQIIRIQSIADGGTLATGDTETEVRGLLANLASIETQLRALWEMQLAGKVDELGVDPVRATAMLRNEGRRIVNNMASILEATPLFDAFSPGRPYA